ncbi:uncharacterized protein KGF55_001494 [Candida pseudojiufengensis]|uniref:uncharacterized protein n=1 Tax=Candida pseudojiufengensis TaxID=497109 RepID=UPI002225395B|nr:uncharacterized protein KGF55_001494 [Candida pseudojiufengensis]KAI5965274.1 hypothetical protein KGF55_001494 [Candida pseudojiufengensis]
MSSRSSFGGNRPSRNQNGYSSNKRYEGKGFSRGSSHQAQRNQHNQHNQYNQHNQHHQTNQSSSRQDHRHFNSRPTQSRTQHGNSSFRARSNLYQQHSSTPSTHQSRDNTYQIWMGDLDPNWDEYAIETIWTNLVTKPKSIKLIRDKLQPSKISYCFVTFPDQESFELALQRDNQPVPNTNKYFKLKQANISKSLSKSGSNAVGGEFTIFVGDLSQEVNENLLFQKFNTKYPNQIKQVKVVIDQNTNIGKGFGFVKFLNGGTMQKALQEMQGVMVGSKPIRVGIAAGSETPQSSSNIHEQRSIDYRKINIPQTQPELNPMTDENNTCITIHGLSSKFTTEELSDIFIAFGDLVYSQISNNFDTGYIKFLLRSSAESAMLYLNGSTINNCRLKLTWGSSYLVDQPEGLNFEPITEVTNFNYSKQQAPPNLYHSIDYVNENISLLKDEEIKSFANRLDETEITSSDHLYLQKKMCRL